MKRRLLILVEAIVDADAYDYWSDPEWVRERLDDLLTRARMLSVSIQGDEEEEQKDEETPNES